MVSDKRLRNLEQELETRENTVVVPPHRDPDGRKAEAARELLERLTEIDRDLDRQQRQQSVAGRCIRCDTDTSEPVLRLTDAVAVHRSCMPPGSPERQTG